MSVRVLPLPILHRLTAAPARVAAWLARPAPGLRVSDHAPLVRVGQGRDGSELVSRLAGGVA